MWKHGAPVHCLSLVTILRVCETTTELHWTILCQADTVWGNLVNPHHKDVWCKVLIQTITQHKQHKA